MPTSSDTPSKLYRQSSEDWERIRHMEKLMDAKLDAVNERFASLEKNIDETKSIVKKPHECLQLTLLANITDSVGGWTSWWRKMMIALLSALVVVGVAAAGWWWSHTNLKENVLELRGDVGRIQESVEEIQVTQTSIQAAISKPVASTSINDVQLKSITDAVKAAVKEERRMISPRPHNSN